MRRRRLFVLFRSFVDWNSSHWIGSSPQVHTCRYSPPNLTLLARFKYSSRSPSRHTHFHPPFPSLILSPYPLSQTHLHLELPPSTPTKLPIPCSLRHGPSQISSIFSHRPLQDTTIRTTVVTSAVKLPNQTTCLLLYGFRFYRIPAHRRAEQSKEHGHR